MSNPENLVLSVNLYGRIITIAQFLEYLPANLPDTFYNLDTLDYILKQRLIESGINLNEEKPKLIPPSISQVVTLYDLNQLIKLNTNHIFQIGGFVSAHISKLKDFRYITYKLQEMDTNELKEKLLETREPEVWMILLANDNHLLNNHAIRQLILHQNRLIIAIETISEFANLPNSTHLIVHEQPNLLACRITLCSDNVVLPEQCGILKEPYNASSNSLLSPTKQKKVVIHAEAGLGKSRICQEYLQCWRENKYLYSKYLCWSIYI